MAIAKDRIKECRELMHLSRTQLAEKTGLTVSAISKFESGERAPNLESLNKLADVLGVSVDYIIGREEELSDKDVKAMFRGMQKMDEKNKKEMIGFYQYLQAKQNSKSKKPKA